MRAIKMINIKIENCRNIAKAEVTLTPNTLNIRYAINGTGKTTIAKAIQYLADGNDLIDLKTFGETLEPVIEVSPTIKKVLTFDEKFVSTIVFQESEVISEAFEIFIKTPDYEEKQKHINERLKEMNIDTLQNAEYGNLLKTGEAVLSKFTIINGNQLKKIGLIKSLISSESIFQLPEKLKKFQPMMDKDYNVDWVGWKSDGTKYDDNEICPFCTTEIGEIYTEEKNCLMTHTQNPTSKIFARCLVTLSRLGSICSQRNEMPCLNASRNPLMKKLLQNGSQIFITI